MSENNITIKSKADNKDYIYPQPKAAFPFTATAFLIGAATSIAAGYIGMTVAVYTNTRTTLSCCKGELINVGGKSVKDLTDGFMTAFRGGQVLGFVLVGLALLVLDLILIVFRLTFFEENADNIEHNGQPVDV